MAAAHKVEMEDDGQPVQSPPVRAARPEEDDPTQPWSPNYGGPSDRKPNSSQPAQTTSPHAPNPYQPAQQDAAAGATSTGSLTNLSDSDAEFIIASAINAEEMKHQ